MGKYCQIWLFLGVCQAPSAPATVPQGQWLGHQTAPFTVSLLQHCPSGTVAGSPDCSIYCPFAPATVPQGQWLEHRDSEWSIGGLTFTQKQLNKAIFTNFLTELYPALFTIMLLWTKSYYWCDKKIWRTIPLINFSNLANLSTSKKYTFFSNFAIFFNSANAANFANCANHVIFPPLLPIFPI